MADALAPVHYAHANQRSMDGWQDAPRTHEWPRHAYRWRMNCALVAPSRPPSTCLESRLSTTPYLLLLLTQVLFRLAYPGFLLPLRRFSHAAPQPQCGRQASGQQCPSGQCCSFTGFCGSGPSFCGSGCQSGKCFRKWAVGRGVECFGTAELQTWTRSMQTKRAQDNGQTR